MGWISVKDRLPQEDQLIVAARLYNSSMPDAAVCWFYNGEFHLWTDGIDSGEYIRLAMEITHWMPLPEPPKE
jgi:hypothetical protein